VLGEVYVDPGGVSTQALGGLERKTPYLPFWRAIATISGGGQNKGEMRAREGLFTGRKTLTGGRFLALISGRKRVRISAAPELS
jgi:hypothetical protein